MSNLFINEYQGIGVETGQGMQAPAEPVVATQKITYTGTAGTSAAFNSMTKLIGVTSDGIFSYRVSTAGTPATTSDFRVSAGTILYFSVNPGDTISAVTNT